MYCTISREICTHPVVSKKTGHIYEKDLVNKHLKLTGKCPVTEQDMTVEDLIEIKGYDAPSRPRPPTASSIPSLLRAFQNEWDQLMLDSFNLKKHCEETRQQLSHALYQYDAACRVIARLTQERDEALARLADTRENMASAIHDAEIRKESRARPAPMEIDTEISEANREATNQTNEVGAIGDVGSETLMGAHLPAEIRNSDTIDKEFADYISKHAEGLAKDRKKRKKRGVEETQCVAPEVIASYTVTEKCTLHSESEPGITCMDLHPKPEMQKYVVTGGTDATIILFNRTSKNVDHILRGHQKRITGLQFHPDKPILLSCSADNTALVWRLDKNENKWKQASKVECHKKEVTSISLHPLRSYFATSSLDATWAFHNLEGKTLCQVNSESPISALQIHPDGQILGTCDDQNVVSIWDLRTQKAATKLEGHKSRPNCIAFNLNGYFVGSGDESGIVNIWDLRKLEATATMDNFGGNRVCALAFDNSGSYLAVGQPYGVELFQCKKWKERLTSLRHHNKDVTGIRFGSYANFLVSCSRDRTLKIFSS